MKMPKVAMTSVGEAQCRHDEFFFAFHRDLRDLRVLVPGGDGAPAASSRQSAGLARAPFSAQTKRRPEAGRTVRQPMIAHRPSRSIRRVEVVRRSGLDPRPSVEIPCASA
jgi:hypothetical protein